MARKRGKILDSKKGVDIDLWFNVFEFLIVFLAAGILYETINSEAENGTFAKNYLARNSALLINTVYSSPGNIEYSYPQKTGSFVFDVKQNKVEIYMSNEVTEGGIVSYPFAEDKELTIAYSKISPTAEESKIIYKKYNSNILFTR